MSCLLQFVCHGHRLEIYVMFATVRLPRSPPGDICHVCYSSGGVTDYSLPLDHDDAPSVELYPTDIG